MYIGILHLTRKDSIFMIEPKDASKCDERRVKNKLNLLTHKKKGETHIMGNQGMKIWKLGAILVVSLVLLAGLYSGAASAALEHGSATVLTTPRVVLDEDTAKLVVTYSFDSTLTLTAAETVIVITIPEGLTGATSVVTATPDSSNVAYTTAILGGMALSGDLRQPY